MCELLLMNCGKLYISMFAMLNWIVSNDKRNYTLTTLRGETSLYHSCLAKFILKNPSLSMSFVQEKNGK